MPAQFWESVLNVPGVGAGAPLASSTTLTDISPAPQLVLPANYLYLGQRLRLIGYGIFSTTATPTLLIGGYYGGVAGTALAATQAITTGTATAWPWRFQMEMFVRSTGSSGTVWCNGILTLGTSLTAASLNWAPATQTQPVTINTTTANALTIGAQWGTNSSSNTITCEDAYIEVLS